MPLDGSVIAALQSELAPFAVSSRIEKIYQPEADELIITFRHQRNSMKLLLSAHNQYPRVQLTEAVKQNPAQPPVFCMLLRKYMVGARITRIEQPHFERMLVFHVLGTDELNQETHSQLIVEMMGKHSNIILVDAATNIILDSIKRIPLHISRKRQVLPGLPYEMPPSEKLNPLDGFSKEDFFSLMESEPHTKVMRLLMNAFNGISPQVAVEICHRADLDSETEWALLEPSEKERLASSFQQFISLIKDADFSPKIYINSETGQFVDFSVLPLTHLTTLKEMPAKSVSSMLETFYGQKDHQNRLQQRSQDLRKNLTLKKNRLSHKLQNLYHDEEKANRSLQDKVKADLIMANLHQIPMGESTFQAVNYYDEAQPTISIHLDERKTPALNAQQYYKRYRKAKTALVEIRKQRRKTMLELKYLDQIILSVEHADTLEDLEMIRQELIEAGYLKRKSTKKKDAASSMKSMPLTFISSENHQIMVGKNNLQNEIVTFRLGKKNDLWFHVKDLPGSHVVLMLGNEDASDQEIMEAALLAAYYSKGRQSSNVPVDYTLCRHVKKQRAARPGMVIYEHHQTIFVTPAEDEMRPILRTQKK